MLFKEFILFLLKVVVSRSRIKKAKSYEREDYYAK